MKNKKIRISACIVVRNEEKLIERCLDSIYKKVDEILVVHDGKCSDSTLLKVKKYTNYIYVRNYIGVAEPHRVFLYKKANFDWILQIDADEYLSDELKSKIDLFPYIDKEAVGFEFYWPIWNGKQYFTKYGPYKLLLFNKNYFMMIGLPHEKPRLIEGKINKYKLLINHKPLFNNTNFKFFFKKQLKWIDIQENLINSDLKNIEKFNYKNNNSWTKKYFFKYKYPFLTILYLPLVNFYLSFKELKFEINKYTIKYCFFRSLYALILYFKLSLIFFKIPIKKI